MHPGECRAIRNRRYDGGMEMPVAATGIIVSRVGRVVTTFHVNRRVQS
jgi:hypothetical protein